MIANEWSYRRSRARLRQLRDDLVAGHEAAQHSSGPVNVDELEELQEQVVELVRSITDYETLRGVGRATCDIDSLLGLGSALIKARVARGWSQERLAAALDMPKQQIQRYEASAYASANLGRLRKVADALQVSFSGTIQIGEKGTDSSTLDPESLTRLTAGYSVAEAVQDIEKRVRLRTMTGENAREIFDSLCGTYYRLAPLHEMTDHKRIHGLDRKLELRKAMKALSRKRGLLA